MDDGWMWFGEWMMGGCGLENGWMMSGCGLENGWVDG